MQVAIIVLRARLVQRLDTLQRALATYYTFEALATAGMADRIAAVAVAIEELDALLREDPTAARS